jgi:hypothetical protein
LFVSVGLFTVRGFYPRQQKTIHSVTVARNNQHPTGSIETCNHTIYHSFMNRVITHRSAGLGVWHFLRSCTLPCLGQAPPQRPTRKGWPGRHWLDDDDRKKSPKGWCVRSRDEAREPCQMFLDGSKILRPVPSEIGQPYYGTQSTTTLYRPPSSPMGRVDKESVNSLCAL